MSCPCAACQAGHPIVHTGAHRLLVEAIGIARLPKPMREQRYAQVRSQRGDEALADLVKVVNAVRDRIKRSGDV